MPPSSSMTHSRVRHYIFYANCGDISPRRQEFVFDGMMAASGPSQRVRAKRGPLTGSERAGTERSDQAFRTMLSVTQLDLEARHALGNRALLCRKAIEERLAFSSTWSL